MKNVFCENKLSEVAAGLRGTIALAILLALLGVPKEACGQVESTGFAAVRWADAMKSDYEESPSPGIFATASYPYNDATATSNALVDYGVLSGFNQVSISSAPYDFRPDSRETFLDTFYGGTLVVGGSNIYFSAGVSGTISGAGSFGLEIRFPDSGNAISDLFDTPGTFTDTLSLQLDDTDVADLFSVTGLAVLLTLESGAKASTVSPPFLSDSLTDVSAEGLGLDGVGDAPIFSASGINYNVPEPSAMVTLASGAGFLFILRRRRP